MLSRLTPLLVTAWFSPADRGRPLRLEWRFVVARWVRAAFMAMVLPLLGLETSRLVAAEITLVTAVVYNSTVQWLLLMRPWLIASGYLTTAADSILKVAMVLILGAGFDSPFSSFLVGVNVAVAMRYGYGLAVGAGVTYIGVDVIEHALSIAPLDPAFVFRSGFLHLTVVLASVVRGGACRVTADARL